MIHPTEEDATRIVEKVIGEKVISVKRFLTGIAHYVYEVTLPQRKLVIRMAREDMSGFFQGALYWYPILQEKSVPLPKLHYSTLDSSIHGFPVMIMDRLPGKDLGDVYETLRVEQKKKLAADIASFQLKVKELPLGKGFGYAAFPNDPNLHKTWFDVVQASIKRSENRIKEDSVLTHDIISTVKKIINKHSSYFSKIKSYIFLDDTTTKNVIMYNGALTGVVDVDFVCYGDIVQFVGLTNMALLEKKYHTDYIDYLSEALKLTEEQKSMIDVYTLLSGIDFLSEHGHAFNKVNIKQIDEERSDNLLSIVNRCIVELL